MGSEDCTSAVYQTPSKVMRTPSLITALLAITLTLCESKICRDIPVNSPPTGVFHLCFGPNTEYCSQCDEGYTRCWIGGHGFRKRYGVCHICINIGNTHEINKYNIKRCENNQIETEVTIDEISPGSVDQTIPGEIAGRIGQKTTETILRRHENNNLSVGTIGVIILGILITVLLTMFLIQFLILMRGKRTRPRNMIQRENNSLYHTYGDPDYVAEIVDENTEYATTEIYEKGTSTTTDRNPNYE